MHRMVIRFLHEEMNVQDDDFTVHIICHHQEQTAQIEVEHYWIAVLGLEQSNLRKTTHKRGSDQFHNHLPNGVCNLNV